MARKKNEVDREFAKIVEAAPGKSPANGGLVSPIAMGPCRATQSPAERLDLAVDALDTGKISREEFLQRVNARPKTIVELASEYERAVQDCRTFEDSIAMLEEQAASNRASLEEARARRTDAWQAIEQCGGAA